jgi:DNA repair and recombination protein RAD52
MSLELVPTMDMQISQGFTHTQIQDLEQALNALVIKERPGPGGKALKYISGKTAIDTANRIFGIGKWGYRVLSLTRETAGEQTFYTADVELYVHGCPFPFPGQGEGVPQRDTADQYAKARKEAVTDALKRALRHFGDQFGLALYDEESLVEDANGNLTQVKNVHPGKTQQNGNKPTMPPAKKTVDAVPSQPQQAEAPRQTHHTPLVQAMLDAREVGMITGNTKEERTSSWEEWVIMMFGSLLSAEELAKPASIAKINETIKAQKAKQAS